MGYSDRRPVTKEPWYMPITERYLPDWDRWARDYDKDMAPWTRLLQEAR